MSKNSIDVYTEKNEETGEQEALPKKKNRILCIILRENKATVWVWVSKKHKKFRYCDNTYFMVRSGIYVSDNNMLCAVYIEGISTPLTDANIQKEKRKVVYKNPQGKKQTHEYVGIKGLKWDSEVIDMLLNRGLADEFTKKEKDATDIIIVIGIIAIAAIGAINIYLNVRGGV